MQALQYHRIIVITFLRLSYIKGNIKNIGSFSVLTEYQKYIIIRTSIAEKKKTYVIFLSVEHNKKLWYK